MCVQHAPTSGVAITGGRYPLFSQGGGPKLKRLLGGQKGLAGWHLREDSNGKSDYHDYVGGFQTINTGLTKNLRADYTRPRHKMVATDISGYLKVKSIAYRHFG